MAMLLMCNAQRLHGERQMAESTGQGRTAEVFGRRAISYRSAATTLPVKGPTQNLHRMKRAFACAGPAMSIEHVVAYPADRPSLAFNTRQRPTEVTSSVDQQGRRV